MLIISAHVCLFYYLLICLKPVRLVAKSVDTNYMQLSTASDLGPHCLPKHACLNTKDEFLFHLFTRNRLFYLNSSDWSISNIRGVWLVFIIIIFIEIPEFNANSVDPDQEPRSATSDLGLHCLQMSLLWDARLKWVIPWVILCCLPEKGEKRRKN